MKKPSDINRKDVSGISRRRLLSLLTAAGFSSTAAGLLTVEDVKATASDEVAVPIDFGGNSVRNVPSDWYDRKTHAEKVYKNIERKHGSKDGIAGVWLDVGEIGGENPFIEVELIKNHEEEEERRGEIPEEKDGVEIEIAEREEFETLDDGDLCSNYNQTYRGPDLPGGIQIFSESGTYGSNGPFLVDNNSTYTGYMTSALHIFCGDGSTVYHPDENTKMGDIISSDEFQDVVFIEPSGDNYAVDEIEEADEEKRYEIQDTLTKDGVMRSSLAKNPVAVC